MNNHIDHELEQALIQHEVDGRLHWFELDRRDFFKLLGCGVVVCLCTRDALSQESGRGFWQHELPKDIAAWIHISENNAVTVFTGKVEMGQNIRTSLAQQVAEELRVPIASIAMIMGDTDRTAWDAGTFGSRTTPTMGPQLRAAAASARDLLIATAAQQWKVSPTALSAANGRIIDSKSRQSITYGQLMHGQQLVKLITTPAPLTPPVDWKIAGTPVPKIDGRAFVTGRHKYSADLSRPDMLFGKVLRPSGFKATLTSLDTKAAEAIPGVIVAHDGDFVAVAAADSSTAERALRAIKAKWSVPPQPSNADLFSYLKDHVTASRRDEPHIVGSVDRALADADIKLSQTYTVQYIAHAPLEPRAALAEWQGDKLTVYTGTQRPFAVRDELADAFHISSDKVRVLVPDTGSAYGGKHTGDAAVEAARIAKAAGKPVKLVWTREEEFTWAYFRPAGVIDIRSGAHKDGTIVAWEFHNYNSGPAGIGSPYSIANQKIEFHPVDSPLRQGSYRSLAAAANHFARESHMDELAHAVAMDPLDFRLKNLDDDRLRAVFQAAADKFGWRNRKPSSTRGFGIAGGFEKGGYVATCAEVEIVGEKNVHIRRVVEAFDCGPVINPNGLRNQIMGGIVQGIGGALFEAIRFSNGRILNPYFSEYRVPRFADAPEIEIILMDRKDKPPMGAGETPLIGLAPAVGNAIFSATGIRLRSLPMVPNGLPSKRA